MNNCNECTCDPQYGFTECTRRDCNSHNPSYSPNNNNGKIIFTIFRTISSPIWRKQKRSLLFSTFAGAFGGQKCPKGRFYHVDCNTCTCDANTNTYHCTEKNCHSRQNCTPYHSYQNDCNTCTCDSMGLGYTCTQNKCSGFWTRFFRSVGLGRVSLYIAKILTEIL